MNAQFEREPDLGRRQVRTPDRGPDRCRAGQRTDRLGLDLRIARARYRAIQSQCRSPSPHSEAAAPGDELGRVRRGPAPEGKSHVWFTAEVIAAWRAEPRTTRGGQPRYSALAIRTALTLRAVFRLALRQTEGLIGSSEQLAMNGPSGDPDQTIARFLIIMVRVANVVFYSGRYRSWGVHRRRRGWTFSRPVRGKLWIASEDGGLTKCKRCNAGCSIGDRFLLTGRTSCVFIIDCPALSGPRSPGSGRKPGVPFPCRRSAPDDAR